jgi:hypothetical protein
MSSSHRTGAFPPHPGLRARMAAESTAAATLLGSEHPLARALRASQTAIDQLLVLTVVDASAAGLVSGGAPIGLPLLVASVLVQWGIILRLIFTRDQVRSESCELIMTGGAPRTLASVERERTRLIDPRSRARLADQLEDVAARAIATPAATQPVLDLWLVCKLEPQLHEIASLLRGEITDLSGVALIERLVTDAGSPLYGSREDLLREELDRIRYRLLAAQAP